MERYISKQIVRRREDVTYVAKELELCPEITRDSAGLVELSRPPPTLGSDNDMDAA